MIRRFEIDSVLREVVRRVGVDVLFDLGEREPRGAAPCQENRVNPASRAEFEHVLAVEGHGHQDVTELQQREKRC